MCERVCVCLLNAIFGETDLSQDLKNGAVYKIGATLHDPNFFGYDFALRTLKLGLSQKDFKLSQL